MWSRLHSAAEWMQLRGNIKFYSNIEKLYLTWISKVVADTQITQST